MRKVGRVNVKVGSAGGLADLYAIHHVGRTEARGVVRRRRNHFKANANSALVLFGDHAVVWGEELGAGLQGVVLKRQPLTQFGATVVDRLGKVAVRGAPDADP